MQTDYQSILKTITPHTNLPKIFNTLCPTTHSAFIKSYLSTATTIPNHFLNTLIEKTDSETALLLIDKLITLKKEIFYVSLVFDKFNLSQVQIRSILERENSAQYVAESVKESELPFYYNLILNDHDVIVLRNVCGILLSVAKKFKNSINIERLLPMLDTQHVFMRIMYLDLLNALDANDMNILGQRTLDISHIVRLKSLSIVLSIMSGHPIDPILLQLSLDRITDKTIMVRKKALSIVTLVNDAPTLNYTINKIKLLVSTDCKCEIQELCGALQHCYRAGIDVSQIYTTLLLRNASQEVLNVIINSIHTLKNIIHFLVSIKPVLPLVIKELGRRKFFKKDWFDKIIVLIVEKAEENSEIVVESLISKNDAMLLLSLIIKYIEVSEEKILELVKYVTDLFFSSRDEEELGCRILLYRHLLVLLSSMKDRTNLIDILVKNYVKMNFYDPIIGTAMLKLSISRDYDERIRGFLKLLCTKNTNRLKITGFLGDVAVEQAKIVDELERRSKKARRKEKSDGLSICGTVNNSIINNSVMEDVKERRRSLNASRMSFRNSMEGDIEKMGKKSEDEVADILFYVKEREILYGSNSLITPFVQMVLDGCNSEDLNILITSFNCILKFMSISSEFFERNFSVFESGLRHKNFIVRSNCIIMMRDYLINYNFILEKKTDYLFDSLFDAEFQVRKHAILVVYDLLYKNILKPRANSYKLSLLVIDGDEEIRNMGISLFSRLKNESILSTILYETLLQLSDVEDILKVILVGMSDKIKESCFLKILRHSEKRENCRVFFNMGSFSAKFVKDLEMYEEYNEIVAANENS